MANDGDGNVRHGGGNRRLEELWTARVNLRDFEARARPHREARLSSRGDHDLRRARRREIPAPPELSESDEEGIRYQRYRDCDSSSDEEVEQWILGEPRFAAQTRYLHHLQPLSHRYHHSHPPPLSSSSSYTHQTSSPHTDLPYIHRIGHHTRETLKTPNQKFDNTHENQIGITKINSGFSPKTHRPSQFHDHHHSFNTTCETQSIKTDSPSTKTHHQPQSKASTISEIKRQLKTFAIENRGVCDSQFSAVASSEVNNNKQINSLLFDFAENENLSSCSAPNDNVKIQICQTHENLTGTNSNSKTKPSLPRNRPTTLVDMMQFVSDWFDFEEIWVDESAESERINRSESELSKNEIGDDDFCDVLRDRVVNCVDSVQEKVEEILVDEITESENIAKIEEDDDFDLAREVFDKMPERDLVSWNVMISGYLRNKNLSEAGELFKAMTCRNVGSWNTMITGYAQSSEITLARNLFDRSPLDTIAYDSVHFAEPVNDKIVLSVLIGQIVSTLGFGFENVKTKGVRRRQWQIAWASLACHWTIVLVPLWLWVALRRDFSVGVYHSHKPNRGLRSIVGLLVHFPRASTELEVEFFSKKGRLM